MNYEAKFYTDKRESNSQPDVLWQKGKLSEFTAKKKTSSFNHADHSFTI